MWCLGDVATWKLSWLLCDWLHPGQWGNKQFSDQTRWKNGRKQILHMWSSAFWMLILAFSWWDTSAQSQEQGQRVRIHLEEVMDHKGLPNTSGNFPSVDFACPIVLHLTWIAPLCREPGISMLTWKYITWQSLLLGPLHPGNQDCNHYSDHRH